MPKGTFKPYLLYEMFTHEKAGFPQINEESPPFFVYRIKSRFSVKRRNPNPSPTWKIKFGFLSFGPSGESRTHGLLNPIQARYQTALHPDVSLRRHVILYPVNGNLSIDFFDFFESFCRNLFVGAVLPRWAGILRKVHKQIPFILGGSHIYPRIHTAGMRRNPSFAVSHCR